MEKIRKLTASEIEARAQTVKSNGCSLLLYKDARVDMKILDETFGANNWQRTHEVINGNLFCNIDIWDTEKGEWVRKQDVGVESYTEKEKGQASDAFKRAGFNVGIGRELYTAPFIWITLSENEIVKQGERLSVKTRFEVKSIGYDEDGNINHLIIVDNRGAKRYEMGKDAKPSVSFETVMAMAEKITDKDEARKMCSNPDYKEFSDDLINYFNEYFKNA